MEREAAGQTRALLALKPLVSVTHLGRNVVEIEDVADSARGQFDCILKCITS